MAKSTADLVARLRSAESNKALDIGNAWNLLGEAAARLEAQVLEIDDLKNGAGEKREPGRTGTPSEQASSGAEVAPPVVSVASGASPPAQRPPVSTQCGRPNCRSGPNYTHSEEFRIDGYCSIECRDMHDLESELEVERARAASLADQLAVAVDVLRRFQWAAAPERHGGTSAYPYEEIGDFLRRVEAESATWRSRVRAEGAAEERERCANIAREQAGYLAEIAKGRKGSDYAGTKAMEFVAEVIARAIEQASAPTQESPE